MAYFVVWDEIETCTKGITQKDAWEGVIQPGITTRWSPARARQYGAPSAGRALIIGTPKGYGPLYQMYNKRELDPLWMSYKYDYTHSPLLDPEEIERLRHTLDPVEFASEYLASFEESGNMVFYNFDRKIHVRKDIADFGEDEDVHVNIDFNVGIQASSFFALRGKQQQFIDEMKGHPDTETLAQSIRAKYKNHRIFAYPDPTGNSRKSSAPVGRTDFSILESYGIRIMARASSPSIVDSVSAVNRRLMTAAGDVNMFFHPRCQGTIESIERTKWLDKNPDAAIIDKKEGIEHFSDGVRYGTEYLFPVTNVGKKVYRAEQF